MNKTTIIGIDYSLKSPAVTILRNNEYKFFAFPREGVLRDKFIETMRSCGIIVTVVPNIKNVKNLSENERLNSEDSARLAKYVAEAIANNIDNDDIKIAIEGISFASPGNTKVQYAGYHYVLRNVLHRLLDMNYDDMFIYAPNAVKKTAGKGNYKKHEMIEAFIGDESASNSKLHQTLIQDPELLQSPKAKHYMKPLDDIVDSFWTLQTYIAEFESTQQICK